MKTLLLLLLFLPTLSIAKTSKKAKISSPDTIVAATPTATPTDSPSAAMTEGEEVDLSKITQKYWADGKETELGVVQNRKYTTAKKMELGLMMGSITTDPFLSVNHFGGSLGYHFSPYTSVHLLAWKTIVTSSAALKTFEADTTDTVNTNKPLSYYAAEVKQNFLYGKASIFGKMIIYVDLFVSAGIGMTKTESGSYLTPSIGLGQKIYINERMSINLDYKFMRYNEKILSKNLATLGNRVGDRSNTTEAISLGCSFYIF